jgi:hypothetical protein
MLIHDNILHVQLVVVKLTYYDSLSLLYGDILTNTIRHLLSVFFPNKPKDKFMRGSEQAEHCRK